MGVSKEKGEEGKGGGEEKGGMTGIGGRDRIAERMDERPKKKEDERRGAVLGAEKGGRLSSRLVIRGMEFERWRREGIFVDVRYASVEGRGGRDEYIFEVPGAFMGS